MRTALALVLPLLLMAQRPVPVDNDCLRVVVATSSPGPKGRMHKHDVNRVMIYLDPGKQQLVFEDGPVKDIPFGAGTVAWDTKGGLHTSQNVGGTTFRVVEVELKLPGAAVRFPAQDPVKISPGTYKVELDTPQVRVLRVKFSPRQKIAFHEHALPRVVVPLSAVKLRVLRADGTETVFEAEPGQALFAEPGSHEEESLLDQPSEVVVVECKG
jgi:beta-alanine degradation protein BauB